MTIPLKSNAVGDVELFAAADVLAVDTIEPRSGGHLVIGNTLGASDEVQLGKIGETVRVIGDLEVDGSSTITTDETVTGTFNANGDVNLGNNSGDAIALGGGTTDPVTLKGHMGVGAGLVRIGASVSDYLLDLWLDAADAAGPALAGYNLNENGTNAGAYAVGVDPALIANSTATNLMTMLDDLDAAIAGGGGESLQATYAIGNTIDVTAANGIIDLSNDNADATTVMRLGRTPGASQAGTLLDMRMGANATGAGLFMDNLGSGNAVQIQDGSADVAVIDGAGAVALTPTSGQNFSATAAGAGTAGLNTATGTINLTSTGAAILLSAALASSFVTSVGNLSFDAAAGEVVLDDVGNQGLTVSQSAERTLAQTAATEVLNGASSIIGGLNLLARRIDADGGGPIHRLPIENSVVIAADDLVAQSTVSGRVALWNGNSAANVRFLGIALTGGTGDAGGTVFSRVAYPGNVITDSGAAFTAGNPLFGPDGTGSVTETAPSGDGDAIKRIGWARTTTEYTIEPGPTIVTHT